MSEKQEVPEVHSSRILNKFKNKKKDKNLATIKKKTHTTTN
jgi:hypothetical protein